MYGRDRPLTNCDDEKPAGNSAASAVGSDQRHRARHGDECGAERSHGASTTERVAEHDDLPGYPMNRTLTLMACA